MKNKKTIKNIIIGLVVAIVLLGVYAAVDSTNQERRTSNSLSSLIGSGSFGKIDESDTGLANAEILRILGSIQNIHLDDDIFNNPVFRELEDSRFSIPKPVRIGRPNPFLPIGFDVLAQQQTEEVDSTLLERGGENQVSGFFDE